MPVLVCCKNAVSCIFFVFIFLLSRHLPQFMPLLARHTIHLNSLWWPLGLCCNFVKQQSRTCRLNGLQLLVEWVRIVSCLALFVLSRALATYLWLCSRCCFISFYKCFWCNPMCITYSVSKKAGPLCCHSIHRQDCYQVGRLVFAVAFVCPLCYISCSSISFH